MFALLLPTRIDVKAVKAKHIFKLLFFWKTRRLTLLKAVKLTMRPLRLRCIAESKGTYGWQNRCPWQQLFWYHGKVAAVQHWFGWMLSATLLVDVDSRKIRENITKLIRVDFMKVGCGFHFFHGHFTICNKKISRLLATLAAALLRSGQVESTWDWIENESTLNQTWIKCFWFCKNVDIFLAIRMKFTLT